MTPEEAMARVDTIMLHLDWYNVFYLDHRPPSDPAPALAALEELTTWMHDHSSQTERVNDIHDEIKEALADLDGYRNGGHYPREWVMKDADGECQAVKSSIAKYIEVCKTKAAWQIAEEARK